MLPALAQNNKADVLPVNAELGGDISLLDARTGKFTNSKHVGLCEDGAFVSFAAPSRSMTSHVCEVPASRVPSEVGQPIVMTNAVVMAGIMPFRARSDEGKQDALMHKECASGGVERQIAIGPLPKFADSAWAKDFASVANCVPRKIGDGRFCSHVASIARG